MEAWKCKLIGVGLYFNGTRHCQEVEVWSSLAATAALPP